MRIALVTREYPPETSWGGIGTHYGAFAQGLLQAGCDVEVFTQGLNGESSTVERGITVHRVMPRKWVIGARVGGELAGSSLSTIGLFALSLAREFASVFRRVHAAQPFDVVDSHEHLGVASLINPRASRELPTVVRYQTAYHSFVSRSLANWPPSRLVRMLEARAIRSATCRIATSRSIDEITRQDFPRVPRADALIPNMTEISAVPREALSYQEREPLMLFVGRLMPGHKQPDLAARAFAAVAADYPDWRIEFAGSDIPLTGGGTMWERCERILDAFPGRYHYHGVLDRSQLSSLYRRARIALVPSRIESYGLVALEAMAQGCIPLVADNTALPEVVGDCGIVFTNGSLTSLVAQLTSLLAAPGECEQRAYGCIERVAREFSTETITARNLELFQGIHV